MLGLQERERSLLVVLPKAANRFDPDIVKDLDAEYLEVRQCKTVHLTEEVARAFFLTATDEEIAAATAGPVVVALIDHLEGDTVRRLQKRVIEEGGLNEQYGAHFAYSTCTWSALREVDFFFPYVARLPTERTVVVTGQMQDGALERALGHADLFVVAQKELALEEGQIANLAAGPARALLVEGHGAVERVLMLCGPEEDPQLKAPATLRVDQGLYCSTTPAAAAADVDKYAFDLPHQQTLLLVKPDGMQHLEKITAKLADARFSVLATKELRLSEPRAEAFYGSDAANKARVRHVTSGPVCAMVVARAQAVTLLQQLAGDENRHTARERRPASLRALFAKDKLRNTVHVSASAHAARTEITFFFPHIWRDPLPDKEEAQDYLYRKSAAARSRLTDAQPGVGVELEPSLFQFVARGLIALCEERPHGELSQLQALSYLSKWLQENNPNKPKVSEPEPEVALPPQAASGVTAEGVAFTVEEPQEEQREVVEVNVSEEKVDKFIQEFDTPPMVVLCAGIAAQDAQKVAQQVGYVHLDVPSLLQAEADKPAREKTALSKEIERSLLKLQGGHTEEPVSLKLTLPLLRMVMTDEAAVNRFIITGLEDKESMLTFEQEVAEAAFVLSGPEATGDATAYYRNTGKIREVTEGTDVAKLMQPKFLFLVGGSGSTKASVGESLEAEYGYCHINVPRMLEKLASGDLQVTCGATDRARAAKAIAAGELVDSDVVGPVLVEQVKAAQRFGFTSFVVAGFPRTRAQLAFFESQVSGNTECVHLECSREDLVQTGQTKGLSQAVFERRVGDFFGPEMQDTLSAFRERQCLRTVKGEPGKLWRSVREVTRPHVTLVLGAPTPELSEFWLKYAAQTGSVAVDMDDLIDGELERKTEAGVQMATMLARGQVVPLDNLLDVIKSACRWTNSTSLVLTKFPRYLDEAELMSEHFTVDKALWCEQPEHKCKLAREEMASQKPGGDQAFDELMKRQQQVSMLFAAQGNLERVELDFQGKAKEGTSPAVDKALKDAEKATRPRFVSVVGMPFVGKTAMAKSLQAQFRCGLIGTDDVNVGEAEDKAGATVEQIQALVKKGSHEVYILDGLLLDTETLDKFAEALGAVDTVYLAQPTVPYEPPGEGEDDPREAQKAEWHALLKSRADKQLEEKKALNPDMEDPPEEETTGRIEAIQKAFDEKSHYLTVGSPQVRSLLTIEATSPPAEAEDKASQQKHLDGLFEKAAHSLVSAYLILAPRVRDAGTTLARCLAQITRGRKRIVLDAEELAMPNPAYPAELNVRLEQAAMLQEPLTPDVWQQIFADQLRKHPLAQVFLVNYPGGSTELFPTMRDELDALTAVATVQGVIAADFDDLALRKYCFPKDEDANAYALDSQRRAEYLQTLERDRGTTWVSTLRLTSQHATLADAVRATKAELTTRTGKPAKWCEDKGYWVEEQVQV